MQFALRVRKTERSGRRDMKSDASSYGACLRQPPAILGQCLGRPQDRFRAGRRSRLLQALVGSDQVLPVGQEARSLQDRPRQRLRRQYLAHPDGEDRQGLCRRSRASRRTSRSSRSSRPAPMLQRNSAPWRTSSIRASTPSSPSRWRPTASTASSASPTRTMWWWCPSTTSSTPTR